MGRINSWAWVVGLSALAGLVVATPAAGQDIMATYWQHDPAESASWFDQTNWTGGVPNPYVDAFVNNGGTAIIRSPWIPGTDGPTILAAARSLTLGGKRSGTVDLAYGSLAVESNIWLGQYGYWAGMFNLEQGYLAAQNLFIESGPDWYYKVMSPLALPTSTFTQAGGTSEIRGSIHVGYQPYPVIADSTRQPDYTGGVDADYLCRPGATYALVDGKLHSRSTYVGYGGKGQFIQSNGANTIDGGLYVGGGLNWIYGPAEADADGNVYWPGPWYYGEGTYLLRGGELTAGAVLVGQRGRGRFAQSGGVAEVRGTLQVGSNGWWWIDTREGEAALAAEAERTSSLAPEYWLPPDGTYTLARGTLSTGNTEVGVGGVGRFDQSGGVHKIAGVLRIGGQPWWPILADGTTDTNAICPYPGPSRGSYMLSDGELYAGRIEIGAGYKPWPWDGVSPDDATAPTAADTIAPWTPATFRQSGGSVSVEGTAWIGGGSYTLTDGKLAAGDLLLGGRYRYDHSRYVQTGGVCRIEGAVRVGGYHYVDRPAVEGDAPGSSVGPYYATETLVLAGGRLEARSMSIGGAGVSRVEQTGGELAIRGTLWINGRQGTYDQQAGDLSAANVEVGQPVDTWASNAWGGVWDLGAKAKVEVTNELAFGPEGRFICDRRGTILMNGADLANYSTSSKALAGLDNLRMIFSIGPEDDLTWETYEVAGEDKGFVRAGWVDNFVLNTLQLGGPDVAELQLVDRFDNQPDSEKPEALYLRRLIVLPGSRLDLNGLHLYYLRAHIPDDAVLLNGTAERLAADWLPPGDADYNGWVDDNDLSVLLANWQSTELLGDADFTGDDVVNDDDLSVLLTHWNGAAPPSDVVVPEPTSLALLALGALAVVRRRR